MPAGTNQKLLVDHHLDSGIEFFQVRERFTLPGYILAPMHCQRNCFPISNGDDESGDNVDARTVQEFEACKIQSQRVWIRCQDIA